MHKKNKNYRAGFDAGLIYKDSDIEGIKLFMQHNGRAHSPEDTIKLYMEARKNKELLDDTIVTEDKYE